MTSSGVPTLPPLPPLRDVISRYNIRTKKSLGQHFLYDLNLTDRIAQAAGPLENSTVYEVGPGPGGLTRSILMAGAKSLVAVETDPRCIEALEDIVPHFEGRLVIKADDALEATPDFFADLRASGDVRIIANLPYNISTVLLTKWLHIECATKTFTSMTLMFQKEVAERICAEPGSKSYGRLSVLTGWMASCRQLFDVAPSAFVPPPKVTSTVVEIIPWALREIDPGIKYLEAVTRAAFGQRRKMLRSSLKALEVPVPELLDAADIAGDRRAETLSVREFCNLAVEYQSMEDAA